MLNSSKIIIPLDHRVPANNIKTAKYHKRIREFVKGQSIKHFYDIKAGICHQIMPEFGHVLPGELIVGTDSHTTTYGALGAMSTGIGATEMAGVWATGELWLKVPECFKINIKITTYVFTIIRNNINITIDMSNNRSNHILINCFISFCKIIQYINNTAF